MLETTGFKGLYAIADSSLLPSDKLFDCVEKSIKGGARLIQYRDKSKNIENRTVRAKQTGLLGGPRHPVGLTPHSFARAADS